MTSSRGSSPLARGLLLAEVWAGGECWIIPARAGFTPRCGSPCPTEQDHPRSRGVYVISSTIRMMLLGSSPLARGLPRQRHVFKQPCRIIPARAGFTSGRGSLARDHRDHPRSRGVYASARRTVARACGSSPLARGLLDDYTRRCVDAGIIPARAGFTLVTAIPQGFTEDHPRSRGVYRQGGQAGRAGHGSSPLARGLRSRMSRSVQRIRIIPARAGFTPWRRV